MVLLENVHFNDLKLDQFRSFKCLCELCDCGCFERTKQQHNPECKNKLSKSKTSNIPMRPKTSSHTCPISHYKETFKANYNARPATVYRPPVEQYDYLPKGSIDLTTTQKTEFKPIEIKGRLKSCKLVDNHVFSTEPMNGISSYSAEYYNKPHIGINNIVKRNSNEATIRMSVESLSSNTTAKEHFKDWNARPPTRCYNEHPSYAGEALFPSTERNFKTHTSSVHDSKELPKKSKKLNVNVEAKGSYKLEGPMDLNSNYRETFVKYEDVERAKLFNPETKSKIFSNGTKPFSATTQSRSDYVLYLNHQRPPLADCNPYESNLNEQIYPGRSHDHSTSYSTEFQGIDVKKNPKPKSFKKEAGTYQKPTEKVDGETVTMRDFKPIDVTRIPVLKAHAVLGKLSVPGGKMETKTMSMLQFLPYEVKPIVLHSDPNPDIYVPSKAKFQSETTNSQTYRGEKGKRPAAFKPDYKSIETTGSIDLNSNYRETFINHGLSMCEAKAFLIAKSMSDSKGLPTFANTNNGRRSAIALSSPKTPLIK